MYVEMTQEGTWLFVDDSGRESVLHAGDWIVKENGEYIHYSQHAFKTLFEPAG